MGGACGTHGKEEKFVQDSGAKTGEGTPCNI
jgi:hypothetical protein